jgi:hypothetical protein
MFIAKYGASEYNQLKTALGPDSNDRWIYFARRALAQVTDTTNPFVSGLKFRYDREIILIAPTKERPVLAINVIIRDKKFALKLARAAFKIFSDDDLLSIPFFRDYIILTRSVSPVKVTQFFYRFFALGFLQEIFIPYSPASRTGPKTYTLGAPICANCANEASLTDRANTFCSKECQVAHYNGIGATISPKSDVPALLSWKYLVKENINWQGVPDIAAAMRQHAAQITLCLHEESNWDPAEDAATFAESLSSIVGDRSGLDMRTRILKEYFIREKEYLHSDVSTEADQRQNLSVAIRLWTMFAGDDVVIAQFMYEPWKRYFKELTQFAVGLRAIRAAKQPPFYKPRKLDTLIANTFTHGVNAIMEANAIGVGVQTLLRGPKVDVRALTAGARRDLERGFTPLINF